jgi:hypothetical protein
LGVGSPTRRRRVWRNLAAVGLFWVFAWLLSIVFLWAAESHLVFMTDDSRAFTAPFDPGIFHESTLRDADGVRLQSVLLAHDRWILAARPSRSGSAVTLAACALSVAPVACLSDMPLSSIRPRRSAAAAAR